MKTKLRIILFLVSLNIWGQDINFGVNFGATAYNRFVLKGDSYQPTNSFYTYTEEKPGSGYIINKHKFFNTITFGASARISRKKIGLNIDPQFLLEYIQFNFKTPYDNRRILSRRGYRIPIYLTYHLFNNPQSIHFNAGIIFQEEINFDYQAPDLGYYFSENKAYDNNINYGKNHLKNVFYSNDQLKLKYLVGLGKRINRLDYNLRYVADLNSKLLGTRWQIEFSMLFYFLSKEEFSTKNYLYEE